MSKFDLDKEIKSIKKNQKKELKDRQDKDISVRSLEDALGIALMKLAMRDEEKVNLQDLMRPLDVLDKDKK
mgnify:CR=1 FL=1|tara:strand:- start:1069 stop:1281 length:213 start_codon:yes stop_codon:yes gene_type:complete